MSILPEVGRNSVEYRTSRGVNFDSKRPKMVIFWLKILISRRTSMLIEQNTCNWSQMEDIQLWTSKNSKNERCGLPGGPLRAIKISKIFKIDQNCDFCCFASKQIILK